MRTKAARSISANTKDPELIHDRREQLIRAALEVFQEKGFHITTVRDIGGATSLTQGTIYNYVRSKEDILFLVCDRVIAQYVASMEEAEAATEGITLSFCKNLRGHSCARSARRHLAPHWWATGWGHRGCFGSRFSFGY